MSSGPATGRRQAPGWPAPWTGRDASTTCSSTTGSTCSRRRSSACVGRPRPPSTSGRRPAPSTSTRSPARLPQEALSAAEAEANRLVWAEPAGRRAGAPAGGTDGAAAPEGCDQGSTRRGGRPVTATWWTHRPAAGPTREGPERWAPSPCSGPRSGVRARGSSSPAAAGCSRFCTRPRSGSPRPARCCAALLPELAVAVGKLSEEGQAQHQGARGTARDARRRGGGAALGDPPGRRAGVGQAFRGPLGRRRGSRRSRGLAARGRIALVGAVNGDRAHLCFARARGPGVNLGERLREAVALLGGKGGGAPELAQGSGPDAVRLDEVLAAAASRAGIE